MSRPRGERQCSRGAVALLVAVSSLALNALLSADALGIGVSGATPFGLSAVIPAGQPASSYFQFSLQGGQRTSASVELSNLGTKPETLRLGASSGVTVSNSGVGYSASFSGCSGASCWIEGLPSTVTLAAGKSEKIPFSVTVPAGTPDRQYLAGITAEPTTSGPSVEVGNNGNTEARAIVIDQITVGVAVTVGSVASLSARLVIVKVEGTTIGKIPRLLVKVRNVGQTFAKGNGEARCTVGAIHRTLPVRVGTILPGQSATVPVNATGFVAGKPLNCTVSVPFASSGKATWTGKILTPVPAKNRVVHVGSGEYAVLPPNRLPTWVIVALIAAGALVVALALSLLVLVRRRRSLVGHVPEEGSDGGEPDA